MPKLNVSESFARNLRDLKSRVKINTKPSIRGNISKGTLIDLTGDSRNKDFLEKSASVQKGLQTVASKTKKLAGQAAGVAGRAIVDLKDEVSDSASLIKINSEYASLKAKEKESGLTAAEKLRKANLAKERDLSLERSRKRLKN